MARPLRLDAPGEFFHVLARGNGRLPIFADDHDRTMFLELIDEVVRRFDVRCHGFCLMENHYHLLLQPMAGGLPRALRQLNGIYAQRFNRRHRRCGHLFEGRYKALLVDAQTYLLELARYIVLNPVRAQLVAVPGAWRWSNYRATAGLEVPPPFLTVEFIRRASRGRGGADGALDFQRLIATANDARDADIDGLIAHAAIAGSRPFLKRVSVERHQDPGGEIPIRQRLGRPPLTEILGDAVSRSERDLRIRAAVLEHRYTQASVAKASRLSRNTVSRIVRATSQPSAFSGLMVQRET